MNSVIQSLTPESLAKYFDHTLLRPNATRKDFVVFCEDCKKYGFKMAAINPGAVELCKKLLQNSDVRVGAAIGFPLGQTTIESKVFETRDAIEKGADEIDYVVNLTQLKDGNYDFVRKEMQEIVEVCKAHDVTSKVIFENCYLSDREKRILCRIALDVRPDFIKTSTGFGTSGATFDDISLMQDEVMCQISIKAAGGIRDLSTALRFIEMGVQRIGSTASIRIIESFRQEAKLI